MKYIKLFKQSSDYQAFTMWEEYVIPNVCYIEETEGVITTPYIAPLLTFTVAGIEYQAEEGMTWEEFCNSEYNTGGFYISDMYVKKGSYPDRYEVYNDGYPHTSKTNPPDTIINGHSYDLAREGSGD